MVEEYLDPSSKQTRERLWQHLNAIAKERDPYLNQANHYFAREYIRQELSQLGTVESHQFQFQGRTHQNLILNISPSHVTPQQPLILIGAHYDAVPGTPGADDNATGISVLLELARFFARTATAFPLRIVAFDLEEYGLIGSHAYAKLLKQQQQPLKLMLSLEMLGYTSNAPHSQTYPPGLAAFYPQQGNFIAQIGNLKAIPHMQTISHSFRRTYLANEWLPIPLKGTILPDTRRSDHASFWDQGYNAIMVTDTANLRNPHYHSYTDRVGTINIGFLQKVYNGLKVALQSF